MYNITFFAKELQDNQVNPELQVVVGQVRQAHQVNKISFFFIF